MESIKITAEGGKTKQVLILVVLGKEVVIRQTRPHMCGDVIE